MDQDDVKKLNKNMKKLEETIDRSVSLKWNLLKGIVNGVGYAIGATIIFGILIAILSKTINTVEDIPVLNTILENIRIEGVIEEEK
ncbi:MAG: DUF5665 domain-containing protein [Candidatus Dojkabacteria bacterium]|jgi:tetrahydromethanopterin S-methyltransferase subunit G|nr:DUF5665 domain-containing protein [Candidatus Dojkabacteria bacterium]